MPVSLFAAPPASDRHRRGPRSADWRAFVRAAPRRPDRCRRCQRSTGWLREACRATYRAPWRGWRHDEPHPNRSRIWDIAARSTPASAGSISHMSRTSHPWSRRIHPANVRRRFPRGRDTASGRGAYRCRAHIVSTARDTPSSVPIRALWSARSRRTHTRYARRRVAPPSRRHTH